MSSQIQTFLRDAALRAPGHPAVVCPVHGSIDYRSLHEHALGLCASLIERGVERGDRVGICLERSVRWLWAIYGALEARAVYVPLSDRGSPERCARILTDCAPRVVICERATVPGIERALLQVPAPTRPALLVLDDWTPGADLAPAREVRADPHDLAYVMYTSGSSGMPKGVMISHENVAYYTRWAVDRFALQARDVVLSTAPFHFDMSTFDVHACMLAGATLVIASERDIMFPAKLCTRIAEQRITVWKGVSSLLMLMSRMEAIDARRLGSLRAVLFGGEALSPVHLQRWREGLPSTDFFNVYGPTEATGVSTCHRVERDCRELPLGVPIGQACAGKQVVVVREDGSRAAVGERGELCIVGGGVSPGYWQDPKRTEEVFSTWRSGGSTQRMYRTGDIGVEDASGVLHYVGRRDDQVKHGGYRIELGEIAAVLSRCTGVRDAAALLLGTGDAEERELVGFAELEPGALVERIRTELLQRLPFYMVPRRIVALARLARTERGKLDRGALEAAWEQVRPHGAR